MEALAGRPRLGFPLHRRPHRRRVALRQLPSLQGIPESLLRHHVLRLQHASHKLRSPGALLPTRSRTRPLHRPSACHSLRLHRHLDRPKLRSLDARRTAVKPFLRTILPLLLCLLVFPRPASAHVGNKDIFEQVSAGPYKLFVTIRTPTVIPGVANVEVRSSGATVNSIHITPLPITGEASKHPPTSDPMTASAADPAFFTGNLWLMASGSWEVRLEVAGDGGEQTA